MTIYDSTTINGLLGITSMFKDYDIFNSVIDTSKWEINETNATVEETNNSMRTRVVPDTGNSTFASFKTRQLNPRQAIFIRGSVNLNEMYNRTNIEFGGQILLRISGRQFDNNDYNINYIMFLQKNTDNTWTVNGMTYGGDDLRASGVISSTISNLTDTQLTFNGSGSRNDNNFFDTLLSELKYI